MHQGMLVRINGVLPDSKTGTNTSCSVFDVKQNVVFHLLVDAGNGVADSIKQGASELGFSRMPDAILITHAHKGHTSDLPALISSQPNLKAYCTKECHDQIAKEFPSLANSPAFTTIQPGQAFSAGPFLVQAVLADHGGMPGCVIYVINLRGTKIIAGWDFLSLPNADQNLLWKPDLLILGAETYNDHPSTGLISISEAYNTVKRWNAKDCFIVHYSGEKDVEDAKNQWFRGPTKPLAPDELQKVIDSHLGITDAGGKFSMTVARQGMIWKPAAGDDDSYTPDSKIEIEALEKYVMSLEKLEDDKLNFVIEDSINRLAAEFANPRKGGDGNILEAEPLKSMMMKGPELRMSLVPKDQESVVRISIVKGKKPVFADDVHISSNDAQKLERYVAKNFTNAA
jgi:phosphoribosyl 1,2-cyclic phosphodiesterase